MIQFVCPRCGKVLKAPATYGGHKIACPGCGQRLQIPLASRHPTVLGILLPENAPSSSPGSGARTPATRPSSTAQPPQPAAPPAADICRCPSCSCLMRVPTTLAGRAVMCPKCKKELTVAGFADVPASPPVDNAPVDRSRPARKARGKRAGTHLGTCPGCGSSLHVPKELLGHRVQCSTCGQRLIPTAASSQTSRPPRPRGNTGKAVDVAAAEDDEPPRRSTPGSYQNVVNVNPQGGTDAPRGDQSDLRLPRHALPPLRMLYCWDYLLRRDPLRAGGSGGWFLRARQPAGGRSGLELPRARPRERPHGCGHMAWCRRMASALTHLLSW